MHREKMVISIDLELLIGTMSLSASVFAADSANGTSENRGKASSSGYTGRGSGRYEHINSYAALF